MKKLLLLLALGAASVCAYAAAPNGSGTYYKKADGKKGAELKTALCGIIYNRTEQSYNSLWTHFKTTDVRADGKIWDMYSNITNYRPGTDQAGSYSKEGDCYNREHSFPASWFGGSTPMNTDLHHLYPTDGFVNNQRSNYPFGETNGEKYKSANGFSKLGACIVGGYTGRVFEPNDEYKGDFARTYFYMVTCYEEKLHDWYTSNSESRPTLDGNEYPGLAKWQLDMLLRWAANDPVSEKEVKRNNAVYNIQKNRNPFIDYPGLEEYIWGNKMNVAFSYDNYNGQPDDEPIPPVTYTLATTVTYPESFTLVNGTHFTTDGEVTLESENSSVASVDGLTVTPLAVGSTTIHVVYAQGTYYSEGSSDFTFVVKAPSGKTTSPTSATTIFKETFDKCNSTGGNDGSWSGSIASGALSDGNTDNSGWSFTAGSTAKQCVKLGSGSNKGAATTPALGAAATGTLTLTFRAGSWSGDATTLDLSVSDGSISPSSVTLTDGAFNTFTATITGATASTRITIESPAKKKRFFLDDVEVTKGGDAVSLTAILNEYGFATICCEYPLDFTDATEYSAWQITNIDENNNLTLEQVTGSVRGGTGLLLMGENGKTGEITLTTTNSQNTLSNNLLVGTLAPSYFAEGEIYTLNGNTFERNGGGVIPANIAYITADWIHLDDDVIIYNSDPDHIALQKGKGTVNEKWFNLAGQSVGQGPTRKGTYIINGKKIILK